MKEKVIFKLIYFLILLFKLTSGKNQVLVGAIFDSDDDERRIAFRTAIDRANIRERSFETEAIMINVDPNDGYLMESAVCELISQGVVAIFGPSSANSAIVSGISSIIEIPHIMYDWIGEGQKSFSSMTLNFFPDSLLLSKAFADVIKDYTWRSYTIIYEDSNYLENIQDILQIHSPSDNPITVRKLPEGYDYRPFLKEIKDSGEACVILHCSTEKVIPILQQAQSLGYLGEYQSVFVVSLDFQSLDMDELSGIQANVTTVRMYDPTNVDVRTFVYDWEQYAKREGKSYRVLSTKAKTNMLLLSDAVWSFVKALGELEIVDEIATSEPVQCGGDRTWPFGRKIVDHFKGKVEEGATGRIEFNEFGQRNYFQLQVLELNSTGYGEIAEWDPEKGVKEFGAETGFTKQRIEQKLQNKTFIVTSRLGAPFLAERVAKSGEVLEGNARYEGYSLDLIDHIAKELGFKYLFELAPDGKYGSYNKKTKQWDGLVKQLLDGNADLGICDLTMTSARRKVVDFTPPFMTLGISILFAKPENPPQDLFSFLSPFSLAVWIYMATAYLGVSFLLYALARMAPSDWESSHPCDSDPEEVENIWSIKNTTWLTMGSTMGQGCDILPKAASTRIATGMWWFFALMMLNSYTANLAAFLTMSRMDASIENAEDLAKQSKIKYGVLEGGSSMGFFRDSNFSTYQRMWAAMESARPSVFTKNNDEGVERVLKGKGMYAYLMESTVLEYVVERKCELRQVGGWLDYKTYGIAMPFNSPYRKEISRAILRLGESGQLSELKRKWWKEMHGGGKCSQMETASADTPELGIDNVGGVFLVLGVGLAISILVGIFEFLWNIRQVAVEEKLTPLEAFKLEASFALKFWITTKPVRTSNASETATSKSKRSLNSIEVTFETKSNNMSVRDLQNSAISLRSLKSNKNKRERSLT